MSMLNLFGSNPDAYEWAKWCESDRLSYKQIKVEIVSERERRFSTLIQNLVTSDDSTVLKTDYNYPYAAGQEMFYRNAWWTIKSVGERSLDLNPQAMALVSPEYNKQYVLEILRKAK